MSTFHTSLRRLQTVSTLALVASGLLFLYPSAAASDPEISSLHVEAPDPEEIALLEELAQWVDGGPAAQPTRRIIRERPASFEVFRQFHGTASQRTVLEDLPYGAVIRLAAARHAVDGLLVAAVIEAESHFVADAISSRGATGLMQLMPGWIDEEHRDRLLEPAVNIDLGTRYLRALIDRYDGDLELALAAYNAGPTNVRRFGGVPPFRETQTYVGRVLDRYVDHHRELWRDGDEARRLERIG